MRIKRTGARGNEEKKNDGEGGGEGNLPNNQPCRYQPVDIRRQCHQQSSSEKDPSVDHHCSGSTTTIGEIST